MEKEFKKVVSLFPKNKSKDGLCILASKMDETDIKEYGGFKVKYFNIVPKGKVYIWHDSFRDAMWA